MSKGDQRGDMTSIGNTAQPRVRGNLVAALDVGTTKVSCFVARPGGARPPRVIGIGHQVSRGVRGGIVVDMEAAEAAIRATVEAAEQMAGETVRQVVVNLSGGAPRSRLIAYEVAVAGHAINESDLRRILDSAAAAGDVPEGHELVHAIPVGYSIDGHRGVRDPRGMCGDRLGVSVRLISTAAGPARNLATCVTRCHLDVVGRVAGPYASALGCLVEDQTALGVTVIDMGGGTTSIAVFFDGEFVHTDCVPVGGHHVTNDIARGLATPVVQAERMKTLFGNCLPSPSDDRQVIEVPPMADDGLADRVQVPRSMLVGIIRPRLEETFEMVRARLEDAGFDKVAGRQTVLTGGASQLPGVADLAGMILDKQIRLTRPQPIDGLAEAAAGPAFATCAGLLQYAFQHPAEGPLGAYHPSEEPVGRFGRIGQWLSENF